MLNKALVAAVAAAMLSGTAFAGTYKTVDRSMDQPKAAVQKDAKTLKSHKVATKVTPHKTMHKVAHRTITPKKIHRVNDAPDFRAAQTREQRMEQARLNWERSHKS